MRCCNASALVLVGVAALSVAPAALALTGPAGDAAIGGTTEAPTTNLISGAPAGEAAAAPIPAGNPLWAVPLRLLSITRERPLFSPSRRPPPPATAAVRVAPSAPPPKPAEPNHPPLTLVGTIVGASQSIAIFADDVGKSFVRLKAEQQHAGWILRAIHERETIFEKDRRTATLALPARSVSQASHGAPKPSAGGETERSVPANGPKPQWLSAAENAPPQPASAASPAPEAHTAPADGPKPPWMSASENPQPAPQQTGTVAHTAPADGPKPPWMNAASGQSQ